MDSYTYRKAMSLSINWMNRSIWTIRILPIYQCCLFLFGLSALFADSIGQNYAFVLISNYIFFLPRKTNFDFCLFHLQPTLDVFVRIIPVQVSLGHNYIFYLFSLSTLVKIHANLPSVELPFQRDASFHTFHTKNEAWTLKKERDALSVSMNFYLRSQFVHIFLCLIIEKLTLFFARSRGVATGIAGRYILVFSLIEPFYFVLPNKQFYFIFSGSKLCAGLHFAQDLFQFGNNIIIARNIIVLLRHRGLRTDWDVFNFT